MKANEIIVGGQFIVGKDTDYQEYVKVDEVLSGCVNLQGREFATFLGTLEPITITEELLLKNGFIRRNLPCDLKFTDYEKKVCGFWLSFRYNLSNMPNRDWYLHVDNNDRSTVAGCDVQYVHQAQALMAILGVELEFNVKKEK